MGPMPNIAYASFAPVPINVRSCPTADKMLRCRECPLSANRRHRVRLAKKAADRATPLYSDDFDFLVVAAVTLKIVLNVVGLVVRLDESDPHSPPTIRTEGTLSRLGRLKIARLRHRFPPLVH
jgi:hypothetical protein